MGLFDWIWQVALKKALGKGVKAGVAVVAAPAVIGFLAQYGVKVEIDQNVMAASVVMLAVGGYEFVRNFLKGKGFNFLP